MQELPENYSYPPRFAHPKGAEIAWRAAHKNVKDRLIEEFRKLRTKFKASNPDDLIFQIHRRPDDLYGITAGMRLSPQAILLPQDQAAEAINFLRLEDRTELAKVMFWEYIYDLSVEKILEEDADDTDETEEFSDGMVLFPAEPEDNEYDWNGGNVPDFGLKYTPEGSGYDDTALDEEEEEFEAYQDVVEYHESVILAEYNLEEFMERIVRGVV